METITKRLILDNPKISRDEFIKKYLDIIHINSGITYSETYSKMYNSDGTIALDNLPDIPHKSVGPSQGLEELLIICSINAITTTFNYSVNFRNGSTSFISIPQKGFYKNNL